MVYSLTYLMLSIFGSYTVYRLIGVFCGKPNSPAWLLWCGYFIYFAATGYVHLILRVPMMVLSVNILVLFGITCLYKTSWRVRIISTFFVYLILFMVETGIVLALGYFDLAYTEKSTYSSEWGLLFIRLATFAAAVLLEQYRHVREGDSVSLKNGLLVILTPILSLLLILTIIPRSQQSSYEISAVAFMLLAINFVVIYLYDALSRQAIIERDQAVLETEKTAYKKQLSIMSEMNENYKTTRHDLKNHFIAIQSFAEAKDPEGVISYISRISGQLWPSKEIVHTGNHAIDSICNFKNMQACEKGVHISYTLQIPTGLFAESYDITIILGNLLDNALEAVEKISGPQKEIILQMKYEKGELLLQISNPYCGEAPLKEEGTGRFFSSKGERNHGRGLNNVKKAVERCDGAMEIKTEDGVFQVFVFLHLKETE